MASFFRRRHEPEDITPLPAPADTAEVSGLEHLKSLERFEKKAYKLDPNLPLDKLNELDAAIATGNAEKGMEIEQALMDDNSPYPEVRSRPVLHRLAAPIREGRQWVTRRQYGNAC